MATIRDLPVELTAPASDDRIVTSDTSDLVDKDKWMALSRFQEIYLLNDTLLVDGTFDGNAVAPNRYSTISSALAACSGGETILVAPGTYTENITFTQNNITLIGSGTPFFDGTDLIGGTIIAGNIDCDGKRGATIRDLGVDIRGATGDDAISADASTVGTTAIYQEFHNLILIGKGSSVSGDRGHGILCATGGGNVIRNCKFYFWYHGVALRCSNSIVSDCYFYQCLSDSVIVKGDTGSGNAWNNTITNCIIDGTASGTSWAGPIRIQNVHASTTTRWITVSNITAKNTDEAVVLVQKTAGTCATIAVSNVIAYNGGSASSRADFDVDGATDVHFINCMSASRNAGYGFRAANSPARLRAINCSSDSSGAGRVSGINNFDYLDLGAGSGTDVARIENLTFDDQINSLAMRRAATVCGAITAEDGVATTAITCLWTGNGNSTSLTVDVLATVQSGTLAKLYHYQVIIERANSTTLAANVEAVGTEGLSTGGTGFSVTCSVDVGTANTAIIKFTGSGGAVPIAYMAHLVSATVSSWTITAA